MAMSMIPKCSKPTDYKCKKCRDTGIAYVKQIINGMEYENGVECECGLLEQKRKATRLQFLNLPDYFKDVNLDNFETDIYEKPMSRTIVEKNLKFVRNYIENFDKVQEKGVGLYISSNAKGSGKTRLIASIANELLKIKGLSVKFATSMDILQEIKKTWTNEGEEQLTESKLIKYLIETDVLIIDDFGVEKATNWVNEKFYQIINGRYLANKITIYTANQPLEQNDYDERITNRIGEKSYRLIFPEESIRDIRKKENQDELLAILNS